jgi:hypothetical protein
LKETKGLDVDGGTTKKTTGWICVAYAEPNPASFATNDGAVRLRRWVQRGHGGARPAVKGDEGAGKSRRRQVRPNPKRARLQEEE